MPSHDPKSSHDPKPVNVTEALEESRKSTREAIERMENLHKRIEIPIAKRASEDISTEAYRCFVRAIDKARGLRGR